MKKIVSLLVMVALPFFASAAKYTEGKHYTKISEVTSSKKEVREYFSFYCPACFNFESIIAGVKKQLPEEVDFEYNHVDFLRAASPDIQFMLSKAAVVADQLGMQKKLMGAIFKYLQVQRAPITSEKDIRNIFVLNGVDGEKFDKLMKSFSVNSKAKQMKKNQTDLTNRGVLSGVPTLVVNGKYRINNRELDRNDVEKDLNNLIEYLLTLD